MTLLLFTICHFWIPGILQTIPFPLCLIFITFCERRMTFFYVYFLVVSVTFWQYTTILLKETLRKLHTFGKRYKQYLCINFQMALQFHINFSKLDQGINKQAKLLWFWTCFTKLCVDFSIFLYAGQRPKKTKD